MDRARFRVSVLKSKGNYGMVLRQIPNRMFGLRDIGMPDKIRVSLLRGLNWRAACPAAPMRERR